MKLIHKFIIYLPKDAILNMQNFDEVIKETIPEPIVLKKEFNTDCFETTIYVEDKDSEDLLTYKLERRGVVTYLF